MEAAVFLFEIPTGVVADTYSRRLSLIIGYLGMGRAWPLVAVVSEPWAVIVLWAFWGISYTFTSGAYQAWITDEVGRENIGSSSCVASVSATSVRSWGSACRSRSASCRCAPG